jgi:hypothetical protein
VRHPRVLRVAGAGPASAAAEPRRRGPSALQVPGGLPAGGDPSSGVAVGAAGWGMPWSARDGAGPAAHSDSVLGAGPGAGGGVGPGVILGGLSDEGPGPVGPGGWAEQHMAALESAARGRAGGQPPPSSLQQQLQLLQLTKAQARRQVRHSLNLPSPQEHSAAMDAAQQQQWQQQRQQHFLLSSGPQIYPAAMHDGGFTAQAWAQDQPATLHGMAAGPLQVRRLPPHLPRRHPRFH